MPRQNIQGTLMDDGKYYSSQTSRPAIWPPMVSEDGGLTYKQLNVPQIPNQKIGSVRGQLYVSPLGTYWFLYGSAEFLRSTDKGATWNEFAHFTDPGFPYYEIDSAWADNVVEKGPYIWLATATAIHLTSDDGATWQVDTLDYSFFGMTGGKGNTIIAHTSNEGIHWLRPGEDADSSWLQANGTYAQDINGTMLQIAFRDPYTSPPESFIRETKSGDVIDTLSVIPDTLFFFWDEAGIPTIAIDSAGNIFAASYRGDENSGGVISVAGLYQFIPANSSVSQTSGPTGDAAIANVSILDNPFDAELSVSVTMNKSALVSFDLSDILGRVVPIDNSDNRMMVEGNQAIAFDVSNLTTGTYYLRLTAEDGDVRSVKVVKR
jgi:hypothetical protein